MDDEKSSIFSLSKGNAMHQESIHLFSIKDFFSRGPKSFSSEWRLRSSGEKELMVGLPISCYQSAMAVFPNALSMKEVKNFFQIKFSKHFHILPESCAVLCYELKEGTFYGLGMPHPWLQHLEALARYEKMKLVSIDLNIYGLVSQWVLRKHFSNDMYRTQLLVCQQEENLLFFKLELNTIVLLEEKNRQHLSLVEVQDFFQKVKNNLSVRTQDCFYYGEEQDQKKEEAPFYLKEGLNCQWLSSSHEWSAMGIYQRFLQSRSQ